MKIYRGLIIFLFVLISLPLSAQEQIPEVIEDLEDIIEEEFSKLTPSERQRIEMEIKTSSLTELALLCKTLGLAENGTKEELASRIREHFRIREETQKENKKVITIVSAQTSEYFSIDAINEDYARLKGNVKISLRDGDKVHNISADEILFNRTRNIITASGNVVYESVDGSTIETFRGQNITVNIDNWASIFLDGHSEKKLESDGSSYLFTGKVISRSDENATILDNAVISSTNEEALWSISASRIWLLPGSDFAILNAVLKVGEIPVLYFPFFYYPADEIVFHPVLGYRSREGAFVQTTTYLIGQPKADSSSQSSLSRIIGNSNDNEKELQGLFLHSTGKKTVDPKNISLKALVDYYVNLGTYFGIDFSSPKKGILNPLTLTLGVGFSRTISRDSAGNYTPYKENELGLYDGSYNWNESNLFSEIVPFRYRMKTESSISGKYGGLSWSFPFYSDPYTDSDFILNRSESMDWMNMIQQGAAIDSTSTESMISDYRWHINGNFNPSLQILSPVVSRITVSNISTSMSFKQIPDKLISASKDGMFSPGRHFFAPDKYTIYNFSGSLSGTPVTMGKKTQKTNTQEKQEQNDPLQGYGSPISPFTIEQESGSAVKKPNDIITPPELKSNFSVSGSGNNTFSVDYSLSPTSSTEMQFMSVRYHKKDLNWESAKDVDWNEHQSILFTLGGDTKLNFRFDHTSGLFNNTLSFSGNGTWKDYTYLNEEYYRRTDDSIDEDRMEHDKRLQYGNTNYSSSYTYNTTLRPLYKNSVFGQSNLQYTFGGTLVKSKKYIAIDSPDGPELTPEWGSWVKEDRSKDIYGLNSHRLSTSLDANVMDKRQNLTVSADLPPLNEQISTSAAARVWISETTANTRFEKPEGKDDWIFHPINITETLRFGKSNSFSCSMVIKPENDNEIDRINSTLRLWNFNASFLAIQTTRSEFDINTGKWNPVGENELLPKELTLSYSHSSSNTEIIKNRINLTFNASSTLKFDLQKLTDSNFRFILGMTANITGFLELKLSLESLNSIVWRYMEGVSGTENLPYNLFDDEQKNVFLDLMNSLDVFNEEKRRKTGFKMNSFNLSAVHYLGAWIAEFRVGMRPEQVANDFKFISDISFLVQWNPIPEIVSKYAYNGKEDKWKKEQ